MGYENLSSSIQACLMLDEPSLGGGSTILARSLLKRINPNIWERINLIFGGEDKTPLLENKKNIVWIHEDIYPPYRNNFSDKKYLQKIDCIIFVSHWQYQIHRAYYDLPEGKCIVIQNATEFCGPTPLRDKRIKLIYATTPFRGLDVLLEAFQILNRSDIELDIYSSTIVYGRNYSQSNEHKFSSIFNTASQIDGVRYFGHVTNAELKDRFKVGHIFAYPSIFRETSCLSAIEAAIAGMSIVTTNLGALPETLGSWATYVNFDNNKKNLAIKFAHALNKTIDNYWNVSHQERLVQQRQYFNNFWTWDRRISEWESLFKQLSK
jgi:glycosyltransferase involved in cell wall biosynthesis